LIDTVGAEAGAALDAGYLAFESADEALGEAQARLEAAAPDDAAAIEEATKAVTEAQTVWAAADAEVTRLEEAYETVIDTPEINAAGQAFEAAQAAFEAALAVVALDEAGAAVLLDYFQEFLAACEGQTGAAPIVIPPAPLPAPAPVAVGAAPVQANVGLNIQTAAAPVPEKQPSIALLAGMLAAGVAVPTAVALRMRRLASAGG
jgi:hypothetical protein